MKKKQVRKDPAGVGGGIGGSDEEGELSGHGSLVRDLSSCRSGGIFRPVLLVRLLPASFLHPCTSMFFYFHWIFVFSEKHFLKFFC